MSPAECCDGLLEDHDGRPGQCTRALLKLCARATARATEEMTTNDKDRRHIREDE